MNFLTFLFVFIAVLYVIGGLNEATPPNCSETLCEGDLVLLPSDEPAIVQREADYSRPNSVVWVVEATREGKPFYITVPESKLRVVEDD